MIIQGFIAKSGRNSVQNCRSDRGIVALKLLQVLNLSTIPNKFMDLFELKNELCMFLQIRSPEYIESI